MDGPEMVMGKVDEGQGLLIAFCEEVKIVLCGRYGLTMGSSYSLSLVST